MSKHFSRHFVWRELNVVSLLLFTAHCKFPIFIISSQCLFREEMGGFCLILVFWSVSSCHGNGLRPAILVWSCQIQVRKSNRYCSGHLTRARSVETPVSRVVKQTLQCSVAGRKWPAVATFCWRLQNATGTLVHFFSPGSQDTGLVRRH